MVGSTPLEQLLESRLFARFTIFKISQYPKKNPNNNKVLKNYGGFFTDEQETNKNWLYPKMFLASMPARA